LTTHFRFQRGSTEKHTVAFRRDDACVDMAVRPMYRKAMYAQFGNLPARGHCTTQTGNFLVHNSSLPARLLLLGFFDDDALVGVTYTLALVRLRPTVCTHFSGHLTNDLLISTLNDDFRLVRAFRLHAGGQLMNDVVGETQLQFQRITLDLSAEAHTHQIQTTLETFADASHHVVHEGTQGARHSLGLAGVVGDSKCKLVIFLANMYVASEFLGQRTQGAFNHDLTCTDRGFDTLRQFDGVLGYTGHVCISLCHVAKHFAADASGAGLAIGHDAARGGNNGHTQAVHDLRDSLGTLVDAQARTRDAIDALDNRTASVVLQGDFQFGLCRLGIHPVIFNVAFILQHSGNSPHHL